MESARGIEPLSAALQAAIFARRSGARDGSGDWIRTSDNLLPGQGGTARLPYSARDVIGRMEPAARFELATSSLPRKRTTHCAMPTWSRLGESSSRRALTKRPLYRLSYGDRAPEQGLEPRFTASKAVVLPTRRLGNGLAAARRLERPSPTFAGSAPILTARMCSLPMQFSRVWLSRTESNRRRADFQSAALPPELRDSGAEGERLELSCPAGRIP
jgi:hypothetical protein